MRSALPALRQVSTRSRAVVITAIALGLAGLVNPAPASARPYVESAVATRHHVESRTSASTTPTGTPSVLDSDLSTSRRRPSKGLSLAACNALVRQGVVYHPAGWRFSCSSTRVGKNQNGWTYKREVVIKPGMTAAKTRAVLAHEESHIWSLSVLSPAQMTWFSKQLGKSWFFEGTSTTMPAEVWAASQAACAGYPQGTYRRVSCSLLAETLRH